MKMNLPRTHHRQLAAFTLIEMIVVMTLIAMLVGIAAPFVASSMQASRLTAAGDAVLFRLSTAQQTAVSENRPVEFRIYFYKEGATQGGHACQLGYYDSVTGKSTAIEAPEYFGENSVVLLEDGNSPLFFKGAQTALTSGNAEASPFKELNASYRRIVFYPNGSTNISLPLRDAYITLVGSSSSASGQLPPNYYIVQIDPVTGRSKAYRP